MLEGVGMEGRQHLQICSTTSVMARSTSSRMEKMDRQCKVFANSFYCSVLTRNSKAYVSFGGLLMALEGPYKKLTPLRVDYVYLLVKK
jgi:RNA polymerase Rpb8